jgi:DNA-binding GntR family transcriptional regulator
MQDHFMNDSKYRIKRQTITSALVDELRNRILTGDIEEGEQLRQDTLAAEHGVSRIPVREALVQLEGEGFVELSHHKGATVTKLSLDEIREIFDLRVLIEVDLLRRAIPKRTDEDVESALRLAEQFSIALDHQSEEMMMEWSKLNWQFHAALYAPAGRARSMAFAKTLHDNDARYMRMQLIFTSGGNKRARLEHKQLTGFFKNQKVKEATALLRSHLLTTRNDLINFLSKHRTGS